MNPLPCEYVVNINGVPKTVDYINRCPTCNAYDTIDNANGRFSCRTCGQTYSK